LHERNHLPFCPTIVFLFHEAVLPLITFMPGLVLSQPLVLSVTPFACPCLVQHKRLWPETLVKSIEKRVTSWRLPCLFGYSLFSIVAS
jgi:hypothetical protein